MAQRKTLVCTLAALAAIASLSSATAGGVDIKGVEMRASGDGYRFSVTVEHGDDGWDHYADAWEVRLADGTVLGTRILAHPHVNEQPFTRSLSGVVIPDGVNEVLIFARDSVHGWTESGYPVAVAGN